MKTRFVAVFLTGCLAASPAFAFCSQGFDLDGSLRYLVCLHNEQNDSINSLSRTLSENADVANTNQNRMTSAISDLGDGVRDLQSEVSRLRSEVADLQSELQFLKTSVKNLQQ